MALSQFNTCAYMYASYPKPTAIVISKHMLRLMSTEFDIPKLNDHLAQESVSVMFNVLEKVYIYIACVKYLCMYVYVSFCLFFQSDLRNRCTIESSNGDLALHFAHRCLHRASLFVSFFLQEMEGVCIAKIHQRKFVLPCFGIVTGPANVVLAKKRFV